MKSKEEKYFKIFSMHCYDNLYFSYSYDLTNTLASNLVGYSMPFLTNNFSPDYRFQKS